MSEQLAVDYAWGFFKKTHGKWPTLSDATRALIRDHGVILEDVLRDSKLLFVQRADDTVQVYYEGLSRLPEVQRLLEPLPRLFQLGIEKFIVAPCANNGADRPVLRETEIASLWRTREEARLAVTLIEKVGTPWLQGCGSDGTERTIGVYLDWLRFRGARTLEDLDRAPNRRPPRAPFGAEPSPEGRELLKRICVYALKHHCWPDSVVFAVQNIDLGFVPALANALPKAAGQKNMVFYSGL